MPIAAKIVEDTGLWLVDVVLDDNDKNLEQLLRKTIAEIAETGALHAELWIHEITDDAHTAATSVGAVPYRDLWQVRCPLPAAASTLTTRPFTDVDAEALIGVNNRAFSWHPEQSGMTKETLQATMSEPWFNADGFRLYEQDGTLTGFCWTKVHDYLDPVVGEIYVIAVDPSAHGQGLGTPMTLAGLDWIYAQGIEHAMLYVESDNDPANATYRKIGFVHHHTDRAYNLPINPEPGVS